MVRRMTRDPKLNPKPGDVLIGDSGLEYEVLKVTPCYVHEMRCDNVKMRVGKDIWLAWAKSATVLESGE